MCTKLNPQYSKGHFRAAQAHEAKGDLQSAAQSLLMAKKYDPENRDIDEKLSAIHFQISKQNKVAPDLSNTDPNAVAQRMKASQEKFEDHIKAQTGMTQDDLHKMVVSHMEDPRFQMMAALMNYSTTEDTLQYTNKYELCVEMSMVLETLNLFLQKMQLHELFAHDIAQVETFYNGWIATNNAMPPEELVQKAQAEAQLAAAAATATATDTENGAALQNEDGPVPPDAPPQPLHIGEPTPDEMDALKETKQTFKAYVASIMEAITNTLMRVSGMAF
jgi:hypothetical protein